MTESKDLTVFQALNLVKTSVGAVGKQERNAAQGFNFRGIDSVVNAAAPYLNKYGVIVTPEVTDSNYETVEIGRNKTAMGHVTVAVKYTFWGPQGDSVSSTVLAEAMDSGDKACAKAMSVAYRIALLQTLNLPTDEPDPDSESYTRSDADTAAQPLQRGKKVMGKPVNWPVAVEECTTVEELRIVWKEAGAQGKLQDEVVNSAGEKMSLQDLLYKCSDNLTVPKSN